VGHRRSDGADGKGTGGATAGRPRTQAGQVHRRQSRPRVGDECLTCRGETYPSGGSFEQGHLQVPLEVPDQLAQRRLCDAQLGGCPAEVKVLGDRHRRTKVLEANIHMITLLVVLIW
jgi:hypothetical protein